jgi:hypothetical protein
MMNMENASTGKVSGGNVKAMTGIFVNETHHKVQILTRLKQRFENGVVFRGSMCDRGDQVL